MTQLIDIQLRIRFETTFYLFKFSIPKKTKPAQLHRSSRILPIRS